MDYTRTQKSRAYFKRYQTKFRRRRENKTDFKLRRKLVSHFKTKYGTPKYRFVVRFTNKDIICQVIYAAIEGDVVVSSAYSHQLKNYGVKAGLKNYPAAYCTGLLCARRALKKFDLDEAYEGLTEATGEDYHVEAEGERRPFKCIFDIGLNPPTKGNKLFGALKGAVDGGMNIPHSAKKFHGYNISKDKYNADAHRRFIVGENLGAMMEAFKEKHGEAAYNKQYSSFVQAGIAPGDVAAMYIAAHAAIRENPDHVKADRGEIDVEGSKKFRLMVKFTKEERKARVQDKIRKALESRMASSEENEDDSSSD